MKPKVHKINLEEASMIIRQFRLIVAIAIVTLFVGTVFYHFVEDLRWIDALYFSTVSLTTVGYGDIHPETDIGKLFTMAYLVIGIAIIAALVNNIVKASVARRVVKQYGSKITDSTDKDLQ